MCLVFPLLPKKEKNISLQKIARRSLLPVFIFMRRCILFRWNKLWQKITSFTYKFFSDKLMVLYGILLMIVLIEKLLTRHAYVLLITTKTCSTEWNMYIHEINYIIFNLLEETTGSPISKGVFFARNKQGCLLVAWIANINYILFLF